MPVQEEIVSIDLRTVKRKWGSVKRALPTNEEIQEYMRTHGILNPDELKVLQDKIAKRIKEAESGWFKSLLASIYYQIRGQIKIDMKTLYWLMSNFDKVANIMPNEFWKSVILAIDKVGENLLAKEKEKE
jgi:hypothetical protein